MTAETERIAREIIEDLGLVSDSTPAPRAIDAEDAVAVPGRSIVGGRNSAADIQGITDAQRRQLQYLRGEPFVARVVVEDVATQKVEAYLFCRAAPPVRSASKYGKLASYRNNGLGVIAECPADESVEIDLPNGRVRKLRVVERTRLRPQFDDEGWDGLENQVELWGIVGRRIPSLRQHLRRHVPVAPSAVEDDPYAQAEQEEAAAAAEQARRDGARREARRTLSLRDQAILDRFQGRVFRLPLAQRIFLSGPAGTGKTTTLIKRLGQKLDTEFWDETERVRIGAVDPASWVMFTPTELLKLYLKEAFAKEQVAAPESCVKTWMAERVRLARDVLGILRTASSGQFTLKPEPLLASEESTRVWELFVAFQTFLEAETVNRFATAFDAVERTAPVGELRYAAADLRKRAGGTLAYEKLFDLVARQAELAKYEKALDKELEQATQRIGRALLARHPGLLNELAARIDALLASTTPAEDDEEDEEDVLPMPGASERNRALRALDRALAALAAQKGRASRRSARYAALLGFLGDRVPPDAELAELDRITVLRRSVAFLAASHRSLTEDVPRSFQRFRRRSLRADGPYTPAQRDRIVRGEISGSELDVVILAMLRAVRRLAARPDRTASGITLALVNAVLGEYRVQVLVDEAADFSAVQLACMYGLSHPTFSSIFAAGDLRQRMTSTGFQSFDELAQIAPDFVEEKITIGYRQSARLTALAGDVAKLIPGGEADVAAHHDGEADDVAPLLLERASEAAGVASWIADRVGDIERALGAIPSIAVFVTSDAEIPGIVEALRPRLDERHVGVRGCPGGAVVGLDNEVRVFAAEYIKGLEFEAVFLVGVDRLATVSPGLFHQTLYVGATRATRYLGLTCEDALPVTVEHIRPRFGAAWS
jgi:hypothetical protein